MENLAQNIAEAVLTNSSLPVMPAKLDLDAAYGIQRQVVELVAKHAVAGLKAGLTTTASQQVFGVSQPLLGSLYTKGRLASGASIETRPGVLIECEIGVIIDAAGKAVSAGPVIEIPCLAFTNPDDKTGVNLAACNVASDRYIVGEQQPLLESYDGLSLCLSKDGEEVTSGPLSDAIGGPYQALDWMLTEAALRKVAIAEGMLLITGACGQILPGKPGQYRADYGSLGVIEFQLV